MMTKSLISELASSIRSHSALPTPPSDLSLQDAYAMQGSLSRMLGPISGYKAGITCATTQQKLGLEKPLLGHLYSEGRQSSGAVLTERPHSAIECEIGVIVDAEGRPISIVPVLEFVHLRFSSLSDISAASLVLCNLGANQYMCGSEHSWEAGLEALFREDTIRLSRDNQLIQEASAYSSLGGPEKFLGWMLSEIRQREWPIAKGYLLIGGTCGNAIPFQSGSYTADYGPLGQLEFTITSTR